MTASEKIQTLVETRINGNSIKGNSTYENMIKSLRTRDFNEYEALNEINVTLWIYKKIDKIEALKEYYTK